MRILIYILSIFLNINAQSQTIWHDLTGVLENERGGWGIGNACGVGVVIFFHEDAAQNARERNRVLDSIKTPIVNY